ncbi:receptor-like serine/threonine-protein kinase NCRK isoform X4 [Durio zibethinus]|uniref:non-specific serine/threonine protein kinase n=1 Tax=Durio zibethinus TaxID=66656 RepID=A0A6P5XU92_DURZI|nr:receptor-like serine/threonine-protein kinase NCRK isoform X4 [Durio zibethinus]
MCWQPKFTTFLKHLQTCRLVNASQSLFFLWDKLYSCYRKVNVKKSFSLFVCYLHYCYLAEFPCNHFMADKISNTSGLNNWTCTCSSFYQGNQSYVLKSNCYRSCDCNPVEPSGDKWTCLCATDGFPKVTVNNHDNTCFTACNCTAGCFQKASFLCRSKTGTMLGTICEFAYTELENATNKFSSSNLIGLGGSSYVYWGQLKDGRIVAVKRLKIHGGPDADSIFSTEVELLSRLHHCHVVPLLGYCSEFSGKHAERLLVFEYMPNGNLRDCLNGILGENMTWETRVAIAIGAARGLEYLHEAAAPRILHRDVKSTNILLDKNWRAKITDLGMAKRLRADGLPSCSSSPPRMQGTFGYFAPEYAIVGKASLMSDVFSFGVVLLELITGRQPIHKSNNKQESLVIWATPRLQDSKRVTSELPDPRLKGNFPDEEMQIMAYLAKECLLLDPDARPTMSEVVQILSTIAPDKSKRRNIPVNFFQMSSTCNMKNEALVERHQSVIEALYDTEEHMPTTSVESAESSLPLGMEGIGIIGKQIGTLSAECMERLVLLSSNARSWRVPDDEAVDLTKPRFESFQMANVKSP